MIMQDHSSGSVATEARTEFTPQSNLGTSTLIGDAGVRAAAAEQMRYQLYLLDRTQRRMSIEEVADALLQSGESIEA